MNAFTYGFGCIFGQNSTPMKTATVTDFRQRMKEHLSELQNDQDILVLTGPRKMDFVVLTLQAYNAMEETAHLLSTPANTERLMQAIAQEKAGKMVVKRLDLGDEKESSRRPRKRIPAKLVPTRKTKK
jgi:antitoxin YefM